MFYTRFRNSLTARTIDDFTTVNPDLVNLLKSIGSKFAEKFENTNETELLYIWEKRENEL